MLHPKKTSDQHFTMLDRKLLSRLLILAVFCFTGVWLIDYTSNMVVTFDELAYPICICAFSLIYIACKFTNTSEEKLIFLSFSIVAGYLLSSSIWQHSQENQLFPNAAQWLGLNYIIAYLFLEVRKAIIITISLYVITVTGHFAALIQHLPFIDSFGITSNIAIAHFAYIVLLWTIVRLRTQNQQAHSRANTLESLAYLDQTTRILNRRGIENVVLELGLNEPQPRQKYAILLMDIDHFKKVNDQHGHLVGDKVLSEFAANISRTIGPDDILGRWGGEEFIIITLNKDEQQIWRLAERIRQSVESFTIEPVSKITVSIGIGHSSEVIKKGPVSTTDVFHIADTHLYMAKSLGRNKVRDSRNAGDQTKAEAS
ncbi:GGDEF domain-containing protein [Marinomonas epiphytica]